MDQDEDEFLYGDQSATPSAPAASNTEAPSASSSAAPQQANTAAHAPSAGASPPESGEEEEVEEEEEIEVSDDEDVRLPTVLFAAALPPCQCLPEQEILKLTPHWYCCRRLSS